MTIQDFAKQLDFKVLCMPEPEREIDGVYIGDLLSWVMGKAESGNIWITIMSNINILQNTIDIIVKSKIVIILFFIVIIYPLY